MLCTFVSTISVQLYIRLNMFTCWDECTVGVNMLRRMYSSTEHVETNVQLDWTSRDECTVGLNVLRRMYSWTEHVETKVQLDWTCSVQLYTLCNVMYSYISSPVFSRHTPFTLLLHQTVWQLCRKKILTTAVSVQFKCIATLNCVCLCAILQYLPVQL
jgi:hypothetical protein